MSFADFQHPPPVSWEAFEDLCLSLYRAVWNDPFAQKNGRHGNPQNGVDVWGRISDSRWSAVQCKGKDVLYGAEVTAAELRTEAAKARKFNPPLHSWTLATSGPKSAAVQEAARLLSEEHRSLGLFEVHVQGWEDLRQLIADHQGVIERHFPNFGSSQLRTAHYIEEIRYLLDPSRIGSPVHPTDMLRLSRDPARGDQSLTENAASRLREMLGIASRHLLSWPTTIGDLWFARAELDTLSAHLAKKDPDLLVLLGPPGAGKSALLARLGKDLLSRGVALLALKADSIPRGVASLNELDDYLEVPEPLCVCLRRLAVDQPVVLLIDQLDALADLMDQDGGRLHVLLRLVAQLRGCSGLAVVLSCRDFEFRHDARLTTLGAKELKLEPVDWAQIEAVLRSYKLSPENWHLEFREVLRVPQHLDIFLRYLANPDTRGAFTNYHEMLDEVFSKRVLTGPVGNQNAAALFAVAKAMGEDEDLWVPAARFDTHSAAIERMVAASFLQREGLRIGFRHQTLFDFVRARAFVAAGESVADYALARQGTIFARPTIWSALSYLRAADRPTYEREVQQLWDAPSLRPHLRNLLRDLMGQQDDPSDGEFRRIIPLLMNPSNRMPVLQAVSGSIGWFRRLKTRMPGLMADPGGAGWAVAHVLRRMVNEETETVLDLVKVRWLDTDHQHLIPHVLEELRIWTPAVLDIAMACTPSMDGFSVIRLANQMQLTEVDVARFVLTKLDTMSIKTSASGRTSMENFFRNPSAFHGLPEIMLRMPSAFVSVLWPWVAQVADDLSSDSYRSEMYRPDGAGMLERFGEHDAGSEGRFGIAFAQAIAAWASAEPHEFLTFAGTVENTDLLVLHCMLAEGYVAIASNHPRSVVDYLLADSRRFYLGSLRDHDQVTRRLIAAASSCLDLLDVRRLAAVMHGLPVGRDLAEYEPVQRRILHQWNRKTRLRLLLAIPEAVRPDDLARCIAEEIRAVGLPRPEQSIWTVPTPNVGMSTAAMLKAKDGHILRFLSKHLSSCESGDPFNYMGIDASRAFGLFAKENPRRAVCLLNQLPTAALDRPATEILRILPEGSLIPPEEIVSLVISMDRRGCKSPSFRHAAAYALSNVARLLHGLDDATCAMLRGWLSDYEATPSLPETRSGWEAEHNGPILWDSFGMRLLPGGNYPTLLALEVGLLFRDPPSADIWLDDLVNHAARPEDPAVWKALADELRFLVHADQMRAAEFLDALLEGLPNLAASVPGVRLLAWTHTWLPRQIVQNTVLGWMEGAWDHGLQAAGEFVALRHFVTPDDEWATAMMGHILDYENCDELEMFRFGVASTAAAMWDDPCFRERATSIMERLSVSSGAKTAKAVSRVFQCAQGKIEDAATERVLRLAAAWPALLRTDSYFLPELLGEALREGIDPELIGRISLGIVKPAEGHIGNIRTAWAMSADKFFELAVALQRTSAAKEGIELFEVLFDAAAHGVGSAMQNFDRNRFG